jgi:hypothetical protein
MMLTVKAILAALHLILVQGPDNQRILLNVDEISSIREPRAGSEGHFGPNVKCLVIMANSRLVGTLETCDTIQRKIEGTDK